MDSQFYALFIWYKIMDKKNFKVLAEDKLLTFTSDDSAGDLHCDTDSHRAESSPKKACVSLGSV